MESDELGEMMAMKRTFTAAELARLLKSEAQPPDYTVDLGDGFKAVQMAEHSGLVFQIERSGKDHFLADADPAELEEISMILWTRLAPFVEMRDAEVRDLLTPDELKDPVDPLAGTPGELIPDELRAKPDDPNLEPDPGGLTPAFARRTVAEAARAKRIEDGTATVDDLLGFGRDGG